MHRPTIIPWTLWLLATAALMSAAGAHAASCPTEARFEAASGSADIGWTGHGHGLSLGALRLQMQVRNCAGSEVGACGSCEVRGPFRIDGGNNRRCHLDSSLRCTADAECGAAGPCRYFAGAPAPVGSYGIPFCAVTQILVPEVEESIAGTVQPDTGALTVAMPIRTALYLPVATENPCPTCVAGTCSGGPRNGLACTVDASLSPYDDTSLDCPPNPFGFVSSLFDGSVDATSITLATGASTATLGTASPACREPGFETARCFCDICNDVARTPCASNADCVAVGGTVCGGRMCTGGANAGAPCTLASECPGSSCGGQAAPPTRPNACLDDTSSPADGTACADTGPVGDGAGECPEGPFDGVCAAPEEYQACSVGTDCPLTNTCTVRSRACFTDNGTPGASIGVAGATSPPIAGIAAATVGSFACGRTAQAPAVNTIFGLPGPVRARWAGTLTFGGASAPCPEAVDLAVDDLAARLDAGWTGLVHDEPLTGWKLRMALGACTGAAQPSCGECPITGLLPSAGGGNRRCADDTSLVCHTDADCGAAVPCRYFASPPMPLSAGGVAVCVTNAVTGSPSGDFTVDGVGAGAVNLTLPLTMQVYAPLALAEPCPRCVAGACDGGSRDGLACRVDASSPSFGDTSFDCPPSTASIGTLAIGPVVFGTGDEAVTLTGSSPDCSGSGPAAKCFCDTCNNAAAETCTSNADCPTSGGNPGVCGGLRCLGGANHGAPCATAATCPGGSCSRPGEETRPNACLDDSGTPETEGCEDATGDETSGVCSFGPVGGYCAPPEDWRGCTSDTDCPLTTDCQAVLHTCFLDGGVVGGTVRVPGVTDPPFANELHPRLGAAFCMPPTTSAFTNVVAGLPGLGRMLLPARATLAEDVIAEVGSTATTDDESDGATPADPVETTVTSPASGEITITETYLAGTPPAGFAFVGRQVQITAPAASIASPLTIVFRMDATALPAGETVDSVSVLRNGTPVAACTGAPQAIPDPCVSSRATIGDDAVLTVLTSAASTWALVTPAIPCPASPAACRLPFVGGKARLQIKNPGDPAKRQLAWKWQKGVATHVSDFGAPDVGDDYALCVYDDGVLVSSTRLPAGGTCGGKPCWSRKPTSIKYADKELTPDGAQQLQLKQGLVDGKAQVAFKGRGAALELPVVADLTGPTIAVRLHASGGTPCFGADFSAPFDTIDPAAGTLKDKAD